jgi:hypothetical protein
VTRGAKVDGHAKDWSVEEQWFNLQRQVFERDGFKCRHCKKSKTELHAHHLKAQSEGGEDILENLVTLDKECHVNYHKGNLELKVGEHKFRGKSNTEVAIIRKNLKIEQSEAIFGFQVKARRQILGLDYSPLNDACSALNVLPDNRFILKCIARGDYQQTKGRHSQTRIPTGKLHGFRKFDKVEYQGKEAFIKGRYSAGGYAILMDIAGIDLGLRPIPKLSLCDRLASRRSWLLARLDQ